MKRILFAYVACLISIFSYSQLPDTVNTGTSANSGTGDGLRTAFSKLNTNDKYLYEAILGDEIQLKKVGMTDSLKLLLFEGHSLYPWLTLVNCRVDTGNTENVSWIGLVMPLKNPSKYFNDQDTIDGHKELLIYYIESETKELKSQRGWGRLDMMETQSAYQIFHERTLRYMVDQEKRIAELEKGKRAVLKRKVKDLEQRIDIIEQRLNPPLDAPLYHVKPAGR